MDTWFLTKKLKPYNGKGRISLSNSASLIRCMHRMQIDPYSSLHTKLKYKWNKDHKVKPDTLTLIEKKLGNSFELIIAGHNFLNRTPMAQALRSRITHWCLMKLKSSCK
jgi:hypothetical protein